MRPENQVVIRGSMEGDLQSRRQLQNTGVSLATFLNTGFHK